MISLLKRGVDAAAPGQLALAMPMLAVIGLMTVVAAAALGGSAQFVAILAVAGFALCGVAPMALIEIFVAKPLRAAADRLRAARDGRPVPQSPPRASGLVADLVALADDVRAAHAHFTQYGAALSQAEKLVAAGDEAIRAFRLHSEELAEATALGESQLRRASQSHFAEIAEALKALRAALPANFEGAVERIESMLVYIGESFDRRETKDKVFESAFGRVDRSFADLGRLMAQETQNIQAGLASAAAALRSDLVAAQQTAQAELAQKIETAETRVLAKLFDLEAPEAARLIEAMRAEAETTRRALREKIEQVLNAAAPDAVTREDVQAVAESLARIEATMAPAPIDLDGPLTALAQTSKALADQVARLEAVAPAPDGQTLVQATAALQDRIETAEARLSATLAAMRDESLAGDADLRGAIETLGRAAESTAAQTTHEAMNVLVERVETASRQHSERLDAISAELAAQDPRNALSALSNSFERLDILERLEHGMNGLKSALAPSREADFGALGEAIEALREGLQAAADAQAARPQSDEAAPALLERVEGLGDLIKSAAAQGEIEGARLRAEVAALGDLLGEAVGSLNAKFEETAKAQDLRAAVDSTMACIETNSQMQGESLRQLSAAVAAQDAREMLTGLAANVKELAAVDRAAETAAFGDLVREALETATSRVGAASQSQGDALREIFLAVSSRESLDALRGLTTAVEGLAKQEAAAGTAAIGDLIREAHDSSLARIETAVQAQDFAGLSAALQALQRAVETLTAADRAADAAALGEHVREALETTTSRVEAAMQAMVVAEAATDRATLDAATLRVEAALQDQGERLGKVAAVLAAQDPRASLTEFRGSLAQLQGAVEALLAADRAAEAVALGAALSRLDETIRLEAERLRAGVAALVEAGPEASRLVQERLAETGQRLEGLGAQSAQEARDGLAALGAAVAALTQAAREQTEAVAGRLDAIDGAAWQDREAAQARNERTAAALSQAAADLAMEIRAAAQTQMQALAALDRDLFAGPLAALEATAGRLDAAADALAAERADVNGLKGDIGEAAAGLGQRIDRLAQSEFVPAVTSLTALNQDICKTATQLSASANALRIAVAGERPAFKQLQDDIAGLAAATGTAARFVDERLSGLDGRLTEGHEAVARLAAALAAPAANAEETARALAEVGQRLDAFAEDQARRAEALEMRVAARAASLDRTSVASALTVFRSMTQAFAEAKSRFEEGLAAFRAPEPGDAFAARFDAFAAAQNERLLALDLRLSNRSAGVERTSVAAALTVFRTITRELKDAVEALRAATALSPQSDDASTLAADLNAVGQSVAGALARFDERLAGLAADQTDRLARLETRLSQRAAQHNRTEVATALTVFRSLSRNLAEAVARFGAATEKLDAMPGEGARAADKDVLARIEALARGQEERLDALELRLATRAASFDRNAVAAALASFRAMGQALQEATGRLEQASNALEAMAQAPFPAPDLSALAQEIAEIGGRLEVLAAAPRQIDAEPAHIEALREDMRGFGAEVTNSLNGLTARMADALAEIARRAPTVGSASGSETKSPGALAKIVVSLADSLDFRFAQIEHSIAEISAKWRDNVSSDVDLVSVEMTSLLKQITSASEVMKNGLSDFIGVSAALVEDVSNRKINLRSQNAAAAT